MLSTYKKAILYLFCNVERLIKIQFDELVSFHSISYLSVVSSMRFKCVFFSRKHPQKLGGIVISESDLTKIVAVVLILITFKSSQVTDIFVSLELYRFSLT